MTNFAVQSTMGTLAPLVSKDKGTIDNRMECAGAHLKNAATAGVQTAALGAATLGVTKAVTKDMTGSFGITKPLSKSFDYAMNKLGKLIKRPDLGKQVTEGLNKLDEFIQFRAGGGKSLTRVPGYKALAVIAAVALPVLGYIVHNYRYKSDQIDQKYTDRAKMEKHFV